MTLNTKSSKLQATSQLLLLLIISISSNKINANENCELGSSSDNEKRLLQRLEILKGIDFKTTDDKYDYFFSICKTPSSSTFKESSVGLIQKSKDGSNEFVLGRFNDTDLEGGDFVIRIKYKSGDKRGVTCNGTARTSVVLIVCNYDVKQDMLKFIEENYGRGVDCNYVFELQTNKICPFRPNDNNTLNQQSIANTSSSKMNQDSTNTPAKNDSGASILSIIFITIICLITLYFVFGSLYMRFVHNARGLQQIPNFKFWNKIGNKTADYCNLMCRCGGSGVQQDSRPYEGLTGQASDDDDHMLNL